jgi:hypothetical protein
MIAAHVTQVTFAPVRLANGRYGTCMTEKQPNRLLAPEEWRLLLITFAGGLASIIVGAAVIGAALALARYQARSGHPFSGIWLSTLGSVMIASTAIYAWRKRWLEGWVFWLLGIGFIGVGLTMLWWIGVAVGVK